MLREMKEKNKLPKEAERKETKRLRKKKSRRKRKKIQKRRLRKIKRKRSKKKKVASFKTFSCILEMEVPNLKICLL